MQRTQTSRVLPDKVFLLGRMRNVYTEGRKKWVTVKGKPMTLSNATKLDKKKQNPSKKQKTKTKTKTGGSPTSPQSPQSPQSQSCNKTSILDIPRDLIEIMAKNDRGATAALKIAHPQFYYLEPWKKPGFMKHIKSLIRNDRGDDLKQALRCVNTNNVNKSDQIKTLLVNFPVNVHDVQYYHENIGMIGFYEQRRKKITLADYACTRNASKCFEVLLEHGVPVSEYTVFHLGRLMDMTACFSDIGGGWTRWECAVDMLLAFLCKYKNIQLVERFEYVDPITYYHVFPYGNCWENDDEYGNLLDDMIEHRPVPLLYAQLMLGHGVISIADDDDWDEEYWDGRFGLHNYSESGQHLLIQGAGQGMQVNKGNKATIKAELMTLNPRNTLHD